MTIKKTVSLLVVVAFLSVSFLAQVEAASPILTVLKKKKKKKLDAPASTPKAPAEPKGKK
ncbi:MAG TPA: hypothetical protein VMV75_11150 [Sulfuricella sp.]|nr:hypothetical protein [Sulfuricella sp.]